MIFIPVFSQKTVVRALPSLLVSVIHGKDV